MSWLRRHGLDLLIVAGAIGAGFEVAIKDSGPNAPTASLWFAVPAVALVVLALLWRGRWPFAAPAALWLIAAALSFADGRLVTDTASLTAAGVAAAFLLGQVRDDVQLRIGLAVVIGSAAIIVWNDPTHSAGDFVFTPALFAIAWLAGFALRERSVEVEAAEERAEQAAQLAVAEERTRIARELHDIVAHAVSVMVLQAGAVRRRLPPGEDEAALRDVERSVQVEAAEERAEQAAQLAVAEERTRIARELHDIVAHAVSVMVLQAGAVRRRLPPGEDEAALRDVERTGRTALTEMRRLLGAMRREGDEAERGPQPGLGELDPLLDDFRRAGLPVQLMVDGEAVGLPRALDLSAYRIIQEGLTNALKHADATRADVVVRYEPHELQISVRDNGRGGAGSDGLGHGLVGVRERVRIYGGEMTAGTANGGGFTLSARLPLEGAR